MKTEVLLQLVIDHRHNGCLGLIPSTYFLGRMYDNNSTRLKIISNSIDLGQYNIFIRFISENHDLGKVIVFPEVIYAPEDQINELVINNENVSDNSEEVSTHVISENSEINNAEYVYDIPMSYTMNSKLQLQIILDSTIDGSESRSNIVTFNLGNSLPEDREFYQNLSYLDRLVCNNSVKLFVDKEERELVLSDDLGNELCRLDIDNMLPKDWW